MTELLMRLEMGKTLFSRYKLYIFKDYKQWKDYKPNSGKNKYFVTLDSLQSNPAILDGLRYRKYILVEEVKNGKITKSIK